MFSFLNDLSDRYVKCIKVLYNKYATTQYILCYTDQLMVQENVTFFHEIDSRSIVIVFYVVGGVDDNFSSYHRRGEGFIFHCCDLSNNFMVELNV
jgi:hypothetical protein